MKPEQKEKHTKDFTTVFDIVDNALRHKEIGDINAKIVAAAMLVFGMRQFTLACMLSDVSGHQIRSDIVDVMEIELEDFDKRKNDALTEFKQMGITV